MPLLYQSETLATVLGQVEELLHAHWQEVEASMHGQRPYVLQKEQYQLFEQLHMLHISTVRTEQGELCGYAVFTLIPCHHKGGDILANLDAFYIKPHVRAKQAFVAIRLLREAEKALQERGAKSVQYSSPMSKPCDALYRRLGAQHTESIYHKNLL